MTKENKELLRVECAKVCMNEELIEYIIDQVSEIAVLPSGEMIFINKRSLIKDFYFGESGYDYDDAVRMANTARKSQEFFRNKNMAFFDQLIAEITDSMTGYGRTRLVIFRDKMFEQKDFHYRNLEFVPIADIIDACGGSILMDELPGKEIMINGRQCRILTGEEHRIVLEAYIKARETHRKKVEAYLKRYGVSKVTSHVYWRDA